MISLIENEVLDEKSFPCSPLKKAGWRGLVFNRDRYGVAGFPKIVFDTIFSSLAEGKDYEGLLFVPAVFPVGAALTLDNCVTSSWNEYLTVISKVEFFPEYFLVSPSMSLIIWVDPDATVVAGEWVFVASRMIA